jgi:DedD protein
MAEAQDVEALKRRGRRRLVGAVALVLAAVIVLPMVFDPEPKPAASSVSVRIPGEGESAFTPKPPAAAAPAKPAALPSKPAASPAPTAAPAPKAAAPAVKPAPKAAPPAVEYVFQVGVFANPENVTATLKTAKVPYYTEPAKDKLTRVRAGPFRSKEAAEKALGQLKKLGLEPGAVTTRAG